MKRGKKYLEAAKSIDRATLYDPAEAIGLAKKAAVANLMRLSKFTFVPDVTDVTQISRSVVQLYYHTELVKL